MPEHALLLGALTAACGLGFILFAALFGIRFRKRRRDIILFPILLFIVSTASEIGRETHAQAAWLAGAAVFAIGIGWLTRRFAR